MTGRHQIVSDWSLANWPPRKGKGASWNPVSWKSGLTGTFLADSPDTASGLSPTSLLCDSTEGTIPPDQE